jgi:CubicO group peptidase (beta-lactamase class C family)
MNLRIDRQARTIGLILTVLCLVGRSAWAQNGASVDAYVARVMQTFNVPGVSLAIVKDDAPVLVKGYGVRKMGDPAPVDVQTLFGIASNTKAFTASALGILVDERRIEWDAPVIRYLPAFRMSNPYVTTELTVRDLLVHRSGLGLGAGDLLWWPPSTYSRAEIAQRLQFIPLATSFRSAYAYDNVLYLIAGEVIEKVSGQSWEDFIASRILAKVGMSTSIPRASAIATATNAATPHAAVDGRLKPLAHYTSDNVNPAGGVGSNAEDMAKWLRVQLAGGRLADGTRLFSEKVARELGTLVTPMPNPDPPPELMVSKSAFRGYALGFEVRDYRGHKVLTHTGGLPGFLSRVVIVPDLNLGVSVLTNQESSYAFNAIAWHIVDTYLGAPQTDWIDANEKVRARNDQNVDDSVRKGESARDRSSRPSLPLDRYAGLYRDVWYGDVRVASANGKLTMTFGHTPSLEGDLEHWQHDTFVVRWRDRDVRADAFVTFALNPDGSIDRAKMQAVSPATDFSFDFQDLELKPVSPPQP